MLFKDKTSKSDLFYLLLITVIWVIAVIFINPNGEFPINDDWAYANNVKSIVIDGKLTVDWWPAMTLVSHTLWGVLFTSVFGFSYTVLRISIVVIGFLATIYSYKLLRKLNPNAHVCFILTGVLCFNPIFLHLSFSYMTDVFFVGMMVFSIYNLVNYLQKEEKKYFLAFCVFSSLAVLCRQQGFLIPLLIVIPVLKSNKTRKQKIILSLVPLAASVLSVYLYKKFLNYNMLSLPAYGLKKLIEGAVSREPLSWKLQTVSIIHTLGLILSPIAIPLFFCVKKKEVIKLLLLMLVFGGIVFVLNMELWQHMPAGNILNREGLGPKITKDLFANFSKISPPAWVLNFFKIISVISFTFLLAFTSLKISNLIKEKKTLTISLLLFILAYSGFMLVNNFYFDRHSLPVLAIGVILAVIYFQSMNKIQLTLSWIILVFVTVTSLVSSRDYMEWQRTRFSAIKLLNNHGINEHYIDGGFEYNASLKPGDGYSNDGRSWWFVDKDDYAITKGPLEDYKKFNYLTYQHYLPYVQDTVFILKKQPSKTK